MSTYTVHANRWAQGWELHIDGVGVTQSRSLADAERMARDYVETFTDHDTSSDQVVILPVVGGGLDEAVQAARDAVAAADRERREAAVQVRQVVRNMSQAGLSGRDIAHLLNVSAQRVSQFLKSPPARTGDPASAQLTVLEGGGNRASVKTASPLPGGSRPSGMPLDNVRFLTVAEAASIMRVSKMTVYRLVHAGELEAIRVGRSFRIPEAAIDVYLRSANLHAV